jgi:Mn2+/Fe2+ NRAMP family transporter
MEGFLDVTARASRSMITRALALVRAMIAAVWFGRDGVRKRLVLSQVILGMQLRLP